jgi:hypothetical protein
VTIYSFPPTEELTEIESDKVEALNVDDPFMEYMPDDESEDWLLRWTVDDYAGGLQQLRGLDVAGPHVERVGASDYYAEPGVYGEHMSVREEELTIRGAKFYPGGGEGRINIDDLVFGLQDQLLDRRVRLQRYLRTILLTTGTFAVADKKGAGGYRHTDTYAVQTYDASTWATRNTAIPLGDFRAVKLLGRGKKADFGARALAVMNQTTFNDMVGNTNVNDLGGQKAGYSPIISVQQANDILIAADLPRIRIWEDGYYDASGFHLYVGNGKVSVLSGRVAGSGPIGFYRMVYQAVTGMPGPYHFVKDHSRSEENGDVPPKIEVHDGHNGGPVIVRPSQVVQMDVS